MATVTTRAGKGSPLTNTEVDANFTNLNTDKLELSGGALTGAVTTTSTIDGRDVSVDGTKLDTVATSANNYTHPSNHAISVITGLQTALNNKVDDTQVLTDVPSGAVFTDTNTVYTHPSNHAISVITGLQTALDGKIDDSQVLTNVPSGAVFTDTNTVYTHPSNHAISVITGLQTALDGKIDDSQVLTNVPSGAVFTDTNTVYTHPTTAGNKHVPTGGAAGQFLKYSASGTAVWATPSYTTNTNTTYTGSTGITLSGTAFSLTDTNAKLNLSGGTLSGQLIVNKSSVALGSQPSIIAKFDSSGTDGLALISLEHLTRSGASALGAGIRFQVGDGTSGSALKQSYIFQRGGGQLPLVYIADKSHEFYVDHHDNNIEGTSYSDYGTLALTLTEVGNVIATGTVTATGGVSTNWNTAYGWGDHGTQSYATQAYVGTAISNLVDSSPAALNTLNELAAALGDDPNFATTVTNSIGTKLPLAGGQLVSAAGHQILSLKDSGGAGATSNPFLAYHDSANVRQGYVGFGSTGNQDMYLVSDIGDINLVAAGAQIRLHDDTVVSGTISVTGGNSGQWNTAYTVANAALPKAGGTMTGVLTINHTNDNQILLTSPSSWTGIGFNDSAAMATDYIWHNGTYGTFAIGGGGSSVSGKKLHVDGGMTVGSGYDTSGVSADSLVVQSGLKAYKIEGHSNVAGTGNASYHPSGIYSTGTNWLYGAMHLNGHDVTNAGNVDGAAFRDQANTAYYVNPYGTSNIVDATVTGFQGITQSHSKKFHWNSPVTIALSTNTRQTKVFRVYYTPAHWNNGINLEVELKSSYYEQHSSTYSISQGYSQSEPYVYCKSRGTNEHKIKLVQGTSTAYGHNYSGQPVYYTDFYIWASAYMTGWVELTHHRAFGTAVNTGIWGDVLVYNSNSGLHTDGAATPATIQANFGSGGLIGSQDIYTQKMYDSGNTAYYSDPASTSALSALTVASTLSVNGNTVLGNASGDKVHINDILHVGATDSGDADLYFGEGAVNAIAYGAHWHWNSAYGFKWYTRNNNTDTYLLSYETNDTSYVNIHRTIRAPNLYDLDDTAYYLNPNGTSELSTLKTHALAPKSTQINYTGEDNGTFSFTNAGGGSANFTNRGGRILTSNASGWHQDGEDPVISIVDSHTGTDINSAGIGLYMHNEQSTNSAYSPGILFGTKSTSGSYNSMYGAIYGRKTSNNTGIDTNWNSGELHFFSVGTGYVTTTPDLRLANHGEVHIKSNVRAPIYYDSNDTGYYGNFADTTTSIAVKGAIQLTTSSGSTRGYIKAVETGGGTTAGLVIATSGGEHITFKDGGVSGDKNFYLDGSGNSFSTASSRAPIFYDSNDTNYYLNPNTTGTSLHIAGDILCDSNYGKGMIGVYTSTRLQHVWSMGAAYRLAADGTTSGNMYGMAWSHPNAGAIGGANNLTDHGLLIINNGSFAAAMSNSVVASSYVKGTLFYDYNNTGYHVDPASTGTSAKLAGTVEIPKLYLNGGNYEGQIVFGATDAWRTGIRQHDDGDAELRIWAKNANGRIYIATGYDGQPTSVARPTDGLVVDGNSVGIGDFSGSGAMGYKLHVKGSVSGSSFYGNTNQAGTGTATYHPSGVYSTGNNWLYGTIHMNGNAISYASTIDGTQFRDYNNTGYYVDPASSSTMNNLLVHGNIARASHAKGFLVGSYNNVGGNSTNTNPIYTIGSSYMPTDTSTSNMYGIGYSHSNFWGAGKSTGWGAYVAENGVIHATIAIGGIWSSGNITAYSDRRVKTNIERIPNALEKVCKLNGYTFDRTDGGDDIDGNPNPVLRQTGVIAQEVLEVLPEAVTGTEEDHYSVAYGNMVGLLIESIKELTAKVEILETKLSQKEIK